MTWSAFRCVCFQRCVLLLVFIAPQLAALIRPRVFAINLAFDFQGERTFPPTGYLSQQAISKSFFVSPCVHSATFSARFPFPSHALWPSLKVYPFLVTASTPTHAGFRAHVQPLSYAHCSLILFPRWTYVPQVGVLYMLSSGRALPLLVRFSELRARFHRLVSHCRRPIIIYAIDQSLVKLAAQLSQVRFLEMSGVIPSHGLVWAFLFPYGSGRDLKMRDRIFKANREDLNLRGRFHPPIALVLLLWKRACRFGALAFILRRWFRFGNFRPRPWALR